MRPEVVAAFRLAMKHEDLSVWGSWRSWKFGWHDGRTVSRLTAKHRRKAQKLYDKARKLESREHIR